MRIVHLVIGGEVAGGQLVALQLARAARARGDDVLFVSPSRGAFTELVRREGFSLELLDVNRLFRVADAVRLVRLVRGHEIDVLHTHTALAANVLTRLAGRLAGVAVVSHMHIENHFRRNRLARAVYRALDDASARFADRIVVVSEDTRAALARQGYPAALMEVVHNGVEPVPSTGGHGVLRAELGIAPDARLVGTVGRLCAVKGQRELIDALALLPRRDVVAVLAGKDVEQDGAYEAELRTHAAAAGVAERVIFAGYRADVPALLEELDLFVLPSWIEGLPLVVLEAMAHGRPVVATAVGGTGELVVPGETGLLVPPRDPQRLAEAIADVLARPDGGAALGDAGRRRVAERFSAERAVARILAIYDEVAG